MKDWYTTMHYTFRLSSECSLKILNSIAALQCKRQITDIHSLIERKSHQTRQKQFKIKPEHLKFYYSFRMIFFYISDSFSCFFACIQLLFFFNNFTKPKPCLLVYIQTFYFLLSHYIAPDLPSSIVCLFKNYLFKKKSQIEWCRVNEWVHILH